MKKIFILIFVMLINISATFATNTQSGVFNSNDENSRYEYLINEINTLKNENSNIKLALKTLTESHKSTSNFMFSLSENLMKINKTIIYVCYVIMYILVLITYYNYKIKIDDFIGNIIHGWRRLTEGWKICVVSLIFSIPTLIIAEILLELIKRNLNM